MPTGTLLQSLIFMEAYSSSLLVGRTAGDHQSAWGCVEPGLLGCAVHSQSLAAGKGDVMGLPWAEGS